MKKILLALTVNLFATFGLQSQNVNQPIDAAAPCGTDYVHDYLMNNNAAYRDAYLQDEILVNQKLAELSQEGRSTNATVYIPIVVHVIHTGQAVGTGFNISDAQINGAIQKLNNVWNNAGGTGTDMGVQFCLAKVDPNGNATSGINRVNGSAVVNYSPDGLINFPGQTGGASEDSVKALSRWPMDKYINVWVVGGIYGLPYTNGYAYTPVSNYVALDGVVMRYSFMSSSQTTLAHEMGHIFNLNHTFAGSTSSACPANADCNNDGDKVCDTSPHKQNSTTLCDSTGNLAFSVSKYIMNYGSTPTYFTPGQKARVLASLQIPSRSWLLQNNFCNATGINDLDESTANIVLYPNPATNQLFIQTNGMAVSEVNIYNTTGSLVSSVMAIHESPQTKSIDISQLANGVYIAEIKTKEASVMRRWVKM